MKKIALSLFLLFTFAINSNSQTLPTFMKDLNFPIQMMVTAKDPNYRVVFSGTSVYYTDTSNNIISSKNFQVIGNGSWSNYTESEHVYAATLNYSYQTPWANEVGNIICLFNRNTGDTIKTFLQEGVRSHYIGFHNDTLMVYNKLISNDDTTFIIKKISTDGNTVSSIVTPYSIPSNGNFKILNHGSSIYIYSISAGINNTSVLNFKRLNLSGALLQSNSFNVSFQVEDASISIPTIITSMNEQVALLKKVSRNFPYQEEYHIISSDTLGQKKWEMPISGVYSNRNTVNLIKNTDSTFFSYGCYPKDSLWSYFIENRYFSTGNIIKRTENPLVGKAKESTSICYLPILIKKSVGWGMLISYRNVIENNSQYPISLVTHFDLDNQLTEMNRYSIRLNGYYFQKILSATAESQNKIVFYGNHAPTLAANVNTYQAKYIFDTDYEYTYYTVGIETNDDINRYSIYPNPSSNFAIVNSNDIKRGDEFILYNLYGVKVKSYVADNDNSIKILKDHLPAGTYILRASKKVTSRDYKILFIN